MTEPFLGEVQLFAFDFAPRNWALCNGATLPVQQYSALFSLLGVQYGGNGQTTFQLPNLVDRAACNQGPGPGLTDRQIGETFGAFEVTLTADEVASHSHGLMLYSGGADLSGTPVVGAALTPPGSTRCYVANPTYDTMLSPMAIAPSMGGQPHNNVQPVLAMTYAIALAGVYPSFS